MGSRQNAGATCSLEQHGARDSNRDRRAALAGMAAAALSTFWAPPAFAGFQFNCFTGKKVQILTQREQTFLRGVRCRSVAGKGAVDLKVRKGLKMRLSSKIHKIKIKIRPLSLFHRLPFDEF